MGKSGDVNKEREERKDEKYRRANNKFDVVKI